MSFIGTWSVAAELVKVHVFQEFSFIRRAVLRSDWIRNSNLWVCGWLWSLMLEKSIHPNLHSSHFNQLPLRLLVPSNKTNTFAVGTVSMSRFCNRVVEKQLPENIFLDC